MEIEIKVTGHAKEWISPSGILHIDIDPPITPEELIQKLGIKRGLVSAVIVGDKWLRWQEPITHQMLESAGKKITIITPVGGG